MSITGITWCNWPELSLPDSVVLETGVEVYPALVDQGDAAGIRLFETSQ